VDSSLIILIVLSLFLGCGCWLVFIWAVKKGEFEDIERPKYRMLEGDDKPEISQGKDGKDGKKDTN
jgi:cbb3-type cytochrome oxidase maturation protein